MNFKDVLPFLTAAAGAGAAYFWLGKKREGLEPWAVGVGGALVGYVAGQFVGSRFATPKAPQAPAGIARQPQQDVVDLDGGGPEEMLALPPATLAHEPQHVDVRAEGTDDSDLLNDMGSFDDTGEDGLGSFDADVDDDAIDEAIHEARREIN